MVSRETINVILAGGGTGGHLYPAIALAEEMQKRWPVQITFIGTSYGIEAQVLPKTAYGFRRIWMRGLRRKVSFGNLLFPVRFLVSLIQCSLIMLTTRPKVIIGTGGYVSGPPLVMGLILGIPTVIQEQNSYPGMVNRLLGRWVDQVHVSYEVSRSYFKNQPNTYVSGNPVRGDFKKADRKAALEKFNLKPGKTTLFIFGGSQGAHAINQVVLDSLGRLLHHPALQILWATGRPDFEEISSRATPFADKISVQSYIDDMVSAYAAADFVVCRSGASALSEIAVCGLPSILIPYPYAAGGHQQFNAQAMEQAGAAILIPEKELAPELFAEKVLQLTSSPEKRAKMRAAALNVAKPTAARDIVDKVQILLNPNNRRNQTKTS
ncbi:MAG: undecaprenyldiphospho-muramoylpentapeptide beta-N-acetylglucosaminyltransferase [bacterium]